MDRPEAIRRDLPPRKAVGRRGTSTIQAAAMRLRHVAFRVRPHHLFLLDSAGVALTATVALLLSLGSSLGGGTLYAAAWVVVVAVVTRIGANVALDLYRRSWRFATVRDMHLIIACTITGSLAAAAIAVVVSLLFAWPIPGMGFWVIEMFGAFTVMAASRFAIRSVSEIAPLGRAGDARRMERTLLYGAGWAGVMIARSSQRDPSSGVLPVGFLDDDPDLAGRDVVGLPVYGGLDDLRGAVRDSGARALLITMPRAPGSTVRRIVEHARALELEVRTVPSVTDLLDGSLDASRLRSVRVEDLLRRPPTEGHAPGAKEVFEGRTVLITGAAGSIGSELARQVLSLGPRRTVLVDRAESALYLVQRELEDRLRQGREKGARWADGEIATHLVNVASRGRMRRLFEQERPDVVLHAAAFKHVPMLEDNPSEAVQVNIGGTLSAIDAAHATDVKRFVLVSTDKAVWPSSVMGASKRIAEMVVADAARRHGLPYASVRFGNVLGSNGSVVPIFQEQLQKGEPLTITHPEMTRYFMTIPEAAWLILDAAVLADQGDLFVLDMGNPVRIMDIARDLARLAGRDPESVPMKVVGLRKGEKLHEELFYDQEQVEPTVVPKVLRSAASAPPPSVREDVGRLLRLADGEHEEELRRTLHAYVRLSISREEQTWARQEAPTPIDILDAPAKSAPPELVAVPVHGGKGRRARTNGRRAPMGGQAAMPAHSAAEAQPVQAP